VAESPRGRYSCRIVRTPDDADATASPSSPHFCRRARDRIPRARGSRSRDNDFRTRFDPVFEAYRALLYPVPGNHEYQTSGTAGCFDYFNGVGSAMERWLRADLAAHPAMCTLAAWHHPRFSSGNHGSIARMQAIWQALY
jgi:hypothetical protein